MSLTINALTPGTRVKIVQQINRRQGAWTREVTGSVVDMHDAPTGSWHAHGKNGRYWLTQIQLRKDDGELSLVSLAPDSCVQVLSGPPA